MVLPRSFFSTQDVLVVDDIDAIRNAVKGMLQMLGCKDIAIASNGERALELCRHVKYDFRVKTTRVNETKYCLYLNKC